MAKVFVSYSRKDINFAKRLTEELQKSDLDFWVDWEGIPPSADWWKQIEKGIEEADVFLFLISPDSATSKVCGQEIDYAAKNSKRIIPLVVRDVKGDEIPKQLSHLNWIFFREQDDFSVSIQKFLTALHTDYEWVQNHRRLQVKALEWERNKKEKGFLLRSKDLQDAEYQLATNTSKEPRPTDLQREYVFMSRQATDRQRRIVTLISIAGVIVLAALANFATINPDSVKGQSMEIEKSLQEASKYIMLASVLGGFAFVAVLEIQLSDKQGKIANFVILMFTVSALMFMFSLISYVMIGSALLVENAAFDTLTRVGAFALLAIFFAILLLIVSIGMSGWLHSKPVGIATTVASIILFFATLIMIFTVIMALPPIP